MALAGAALIVGAALVHPAVAIADYTVAPLPYQNGVTVRRSIEDTTEPADVTIRTSTVAPDGLDYSSGGWADWALGKHFNGSAVTTLHFADNGERECSYVYSASATTRYYLVATPTGRYMVVGGSGSIGLPVYVTSSTTTVPVSVTGTPSVSVIGTVPVSQSASVSIDGTLPVSVASIGALDRDDTTAAGLGVVGLLALGVGMFVAGGRYRDHS